MRKVTLDGDAKVVGKLVNEAIDKIAHALMRLYQGTEVRRDTEAALKDCSERLHQVADALRQGVWLRTA
jgi:hypothetical protein